MQRVDDWYGEYHYSNVRSYVEPSIDEKEGCCVDACPRNRLLPRLLNGSAFENSGEPRSGVVQDNQASYRVQGYLEAPASSLEKTPIQETNREFRERYHQLIKELSHPESLGYTVSLVSRMITILSLPVIVREL